MHGLRHYTRLGIDLRSKFLQQLARRGSEGHALFGRAAWRIYPERLGEAARRRHAEPRRTNEGEQLEQIQSWKHRHVEPPRRRPRVAQHRRFALDPAACFGGCQHLDLAIRSEPQHFAEAGDENRRLRYRNPPGRKFGIAS